MTIGSRPFLAHHPRANRAPTRVGLRFVEIDFSWDYTKPSRIHMGTRSAKLSSGCKDSPTNAFDEAPVASHQALELPPHPSRDARPQRRSCARESPRLRRDSRL